MSVGVVGVFSPASLLRFVSRWQSWWGLWTGAILRLAFGVALWLAAPLSRSPTALQVLAVVSVVAGIALPIMGVARFIAIIEWWDDQAPGVTRVWAAVAIALGTFVLWAVV